MRRRDETRERFKVAVGIPTRIYKRDRMRAFPASRAPVRLLTVIAGAKPSGPMPHEAVTAFV